LNFGIDLLMITIALVGASDRGQARNSEVACYSVIVSCYVGKNNTIETASTTSLQPNILLLTVSKASSKEHHFVLEGLV
jgi:hypothetical protein